MSGTDRTQIDTDGQLLGTAPGRRRRTHLRGHPGRGLGGVDPPGPAAPAGTVPGEPVLGFEDEADPAGTVVVTMAASGDTHCRVVLRHAPSADNRQEPGFGAGWERFLAGLSEALAGRAYGEDVRYEAVLASWERLGQRLERTGPGRIEGDGDQRVVLHRRSIAAAPQAIWDLLTSADGLSRWLGRVVEGELAAGGTVRIEHDPGAESTRPESIQTSTVQVWEPPSRLELTWDFPDEPSSYLRIELHPAGALTDVVLTHRGAGPDHLPGWHAHLDLLVAADEGFGMPRFADAYAAAPGAAD